MYFALCLFGSKTASCMLTFLTKEVGFIFLVLLANHPLTKRGGMAAWHWSGWWQAGSSSSSWSWQDGDRWWEQEKEVYESVVAKEEEVEDKSVKKNNKGKVAGSGTVSLKRREKFQQKGQKRENEMMAKEDALTKGINWDEVLRRGNTKARKLTKQEVEFFFLPKEEREKLEKERKEKVEKEAILTKDEPAKQERKKVTLTPAKKVVALPVTISTEVQAAGAMEEGVPMEEEAPVTTHVNQGGPMEEAPVTTHVEEGCPMEGEDAPVTTHVEEGCPMEEEDAPVTTKVEKGGTMEEEDAPVTTKVEKGSPMEEEEEEEATEVEKEAPMEEGALKEETFLTKEEPASSSATLTKGSTETGESAPMTPPDWEEPVSNCWAQEATEER